MRRKAVGTRIHRNGDEQSALAGDLENAQTKTIEIGGRWRCSRSRRGPPAYAAHSRPDDDKRSVVVVAEADYDRWLDATDEDYSVSRIFGSDVKRSAIMLCEKTGENSHQNRINERTARLD